MNKNISDYNKGKQNPSYTSMLGNGYFTIKSANPIFTPFFKERALCLLVVLWSLLKTTSSSVGPTRSGVPEKFLQTEDPSINSLSELTRSLIHLHYSLRCFAFTFFTVVLPRGLGHCRQWIGQSRSLPLFHSDQILIDPSSIWESPNREKEVERAACLCWTGSTESWPPSVSGRRRRRYCSWASIMPARLPCFTCWKTRFAFLLYYFEIMLLTSDLFFCFSINDLIVLLRNDIFEYLVIFFWLFVIRLIGLFILLKSFSRLNSLKRGDIFTFGNSNTVKYKIDAFFSPLIK